MPIKAPPARHGSGVIRGQRRVAGTLAMLEPIGDTDNART
jgi:hypothetical protein